jgi:hypothetical protein
MTQWSQFFSTHLHHESFYSGAASLNLDFRNSRLSRFIPFLAFCCLVCGGFGMRPLMPIFAYRAVARFAPMLKPLVSGPAMFSIVSVRRL